MIVSRLLVAVLMLLALAAPGLARAEAETVSGGTGGFCLFRLPADQSGSSRWINLAIVQFVDAAPRDLRIVYGGGNFGAGHEARIPVANAEEVLSLLDRMRQTAAACR